MIVPPGLIFPRRSASYSMRIPIRSFTDPPGFMNSHFARIVHDTPEAILPSLTMGVLPMAERMFSCHMVASFNIGFLLEVSISSCGRAGERAGGQAGGRAGGRAGRRAGGQAG